MGLRIIVLSLFLIFLIASECQRHNQNTVECKLWWLVFLKAWNPWWFYTSTHVYVFSYEIFDVSHAIVCSRLRPRKCRYLRTAFDQNVFLSVSEPVQTVWRWLNRGVTVRVLLLSVLSVCVILRRLSSWLVSSGLDFHVQACLTLLQCRKWKIRGAQTGNGI